MSVFYKINDKKIWSLSFFFVFSILIFQLKEGHWGKSHVINICTGDTSGIYYSTGYKIKKILEDEFKDGKYYFDVISTAGSVDNINKLLNQECDLAFVQSDKQYQAYYGEKKWQNIGAQKTLRSLFSLYPEVLTLIVRKDSGIRSIYDLYEKKVNLGGVGSGELESAEDVLRAFNINLKDIIPTYIRDEEAFYFIRNSDIDAFLYTIGHPSNNIIESKRKGIDFNILSIEGTEVEWLARKFPYYSLYGVTKEAYPSDVMVESFNSIGVRATLITLNTVNKEITYRLTKKFFTDFESLRKSDPVFNSVKKEHLLESLTAPIHQGALKYYEESGNMLPVLPNLIL